MAIVAIVLALFAERQQRQGRIDRYLDVIDDFKKWDSEEARLRIAGSVRRLAELGKTDIDLSGIVLRSFSFSSNDIDSLRGTIFSLGLRLDKLSRNATELEDVDFTHVDCRDVVFSKSFGKLAGLGLIGKNLKFVGADLRSASFEGAKLSWTEYEPDASRWYEDEGFDEQGYPLRHQVYYPAFAGADLKGCSFRYAELKNADFRDAQNILQADFVGAQGLESCLFDEGIREQILTGVATTIDRG